MAFRRKMENMMSSNEVLLGKVDPQIDDEEDFEEFVVFSTNRERVTYAIPSNNGHKVIIDGLAGKEYEETSAPVFSIDSKHVAYCAVRGDKRLVVIDGIEGKEYDGVYIDGDNFTFSPDGKILSYLARRGNKMFFVLNRDEEEI